MVAGTGQKTGKGLRRGLWIAAGLAAAIAALAIYRLRTTGFQWNLFFQTFLSVDWRWLAGSILLMLLTYVGRALRWEVMLRPLRPKPNLAKLCSATVIGFTAVVLLGRAGEVVRPYLIAVKEHVTFTSQMAAWLLERIFDLLVVLAIFGVALTSIPPGLPLGSALRWVLHAGGFLIAGIAAVCLFFLIVFRNFSEPAERRILSALTFLPERYYARVEKTLKAFIHGLQSTRHHGFLALLVFYTAVEWALIVGAYVCLFRCIPATAAFGLHETVIFVGFVSFGSIVQIPGIGGGIQVASIVVLTEIFGLTLETATGAAILIWLLTWVIIVPFGLGFAFHEGLTWNRFKHLPEDVGELPPGDLAQ